MWMMGYNDEVNNINMAATADSFNAARRLRPLIPRPFSCTTPAPNTTNPYRTKPSDVFSLNHHLGGTTGEQNKGDQVMMMNGQAATATAPAPVVVSSRWNPTPEQLRVLEDLYRRGTRTPSADQIQHITSQLRRFGKIEGKNVFYWFQNHKARERQKRRRQLESSNPTTTPPLLFNDCFHRKDPGSSRTAYEVEQMNKNWTSSNSCTAQTEETVGRGRATKAGMGAENRWVQLNGEDIWLQERRSLMGRNATWQQMMQLPHPHYHYHHHHHRQLILNSTSVASIATNTNNNMATSSSTSAAPTTMVTIPISSSASQVCMFQSKRGIIYTKQGHQECSGFDDESHQTLQLFPLSKEEDGDNSGIINEKETNDKSSGEEAMNGSNCFAHSHHFYEFLPLKN